MNDAQSVKHYNWGSSVSMIWNPEMTHLIIGFSRDDLIYKFPCGKIEELDFARSLEWVLDRKWNPNLEQGLVPDFDRPISDVARVCALRELRNETHEDVIVHLDVENFFQIAYVRPFSKRLDDGTRIPLAQYHFIGMLRERVDFWSPPAESSEMDIPRWWTPLDILRLDRTQTMKVNPIHQIAFAAGLREMRAMVRVGVSLPLDNVFARIARIPLMRHEGMSEDDVPTTDIFHYEAALWSLIKSRQI